MIQAFQCVVSLTSQVDLFDHELHARMPVILRNARCVDFQLSLHDGVKALSFVAVWFSLKSLQPTAGACGPGCQPPVWDRSEPANIHVTIAISSAEVLGSVFVT